MIGRRVASFDDLERPGDYCRTTIVDGHGVTEQTMFFWVPNSPGDSRFGHVARVAFPPHTERECDDGSLEVRASILVGPHSRVGESGEVVTDPGWHGYLDEGHVWRGC